MPYTPHVGMTAAPGSETKSCGRCGGTGEVVSLEADEAFVAESDVRPHERGGPLS
jgi:DnaJ-class molecular chaperone